MRLHQESIRNGPFIGDIVIPPIGMLGLTIPRQFLLYAKPAPWSGDWEAPNGDWEAVAGDTDYSAHKLPGKTDPSYAAIYAAVNDGSGFWYDSNGDPVARLLPDILADGQTNQWLIWCTTRGRLMIFNNTLTDAEMIKVRVYLGLGKEDLPPDGYSWVLFNGRRVVFNGNYEISKIGA